MSRKQSTRWAAPQSHFYTTSFLAEEVPLPESPEPGVLSISPLPDDTPWPQQEPSFHIPNFGNIGFPSLDEDSDAALDEEVVALFSQPHSKMSWEVPLSPSPDLDLTLMPLSLFADIPLPSSPPPEDPLLDFETVEYREKSTRWAAPQSHFYTTSFLAEEVPLPESPEPGVLSISPLPDDTPWPQQEPSFHIPNFGNIGFPSLDEDSDAALEEEVVALFSQPHSKMSWEVPLSPSPDLDLALMPLSLFADIPLPSSPPPEDPLLDFETVEYREKSTRWAAPQSHFYTTFFLAEEVPLPESPEPGALSISPMPDHTPWPSSLLTDKQCLHLHDSGFFSLDEEVASHTLQQTHLRASKMLFPQSPDQDLGLMPLNLLADIPLPEDSLLDF